MTQEEQIEALMPEAYTFDICGFNPLKGGTLVIYYKDKEVYKQGYDTITEILEGVITYFQYLKR